MSLMEGEESGQRVIPYKDKVRLIKKTLDKGVGSRKVTYNKVSFAVDIFYDSDDVFSVVQVVREYVSQVQNSIKILQLSVVEHDTRKQSI